MQPKKPMLLMKYHPAKKEVRFRRFRRHDGKEVRIDDDSKLASYMNKRGGFVLQDYGNDFLADVASEFDGLPEVEMHVITTRLDYEDFEHMVEYYNGTQPRCRINAQLIGELPSMDETFLRVKSYGEQAIDILWKHRQQINAMEAEYKRATRNIEAFTQKIDKAICDIREKYDDLSHNDVNLCFAGVYSSGKSSLINALLGYRILPEAVSSETAKMVEICSPAVGEPVQIEFDIYGSAARLEWDEQCKLFRFSLDCSQGGESEQIQNLIDKLAEQSMPRHDQIRSIVADLNAREGISASITIKFPIPMDKQLDGRAHFTIYDTPGTDSNSAEHAQILKEALSDQKQSILIFVAHPTKMEGEGNNSLLRYLSFAMDRGEKAAIDLDRSLFVINYSDTVKAIDRELLRSKRITSKSDSTFSIQLSNKKVLFTSALYASAAKAVQKGVATDDDEWTFEDSRKMVSARSPYGRCYQQNSCAWSESATLAMKEACENALKDARASGNEPQVLEVCSGLFALEREIISYGIKHAAAVRVYALIKCIDTVLSQLSVDARVLLAGNRQVINDINRHIENLRREMYESIDDSYSSFRVFTDEEKERFYRELRIDYEHVKSKVLDRTDKNIEHLIKSRLFAPDIANVNKEDRRKAVGYVRSALDDWTHECNTARKELLENRSHLFLQTIKDAIANNGNISDSAKEYLCAVPDSEFKGEEWLPDVESLYDESIGSGKILFVIPDTFLNKTRFKQAIQSKLRTVVQDMRDKFWQDYENTLELVLDKVRKDFSARLEEYSLTLRGMIDSRKAMEKVGQCLQVTVNELSACMNGLDVEIWKEGDVHD